MNSVREVVSLYASEVPFYALKISEIPGWTQTASSRLHKKCLQETKRIVLPDVHLLA